MIHGCHFLEAMAGILEAEQLEIQVYPCPKEQASTYNARNGYLMREPGLETQRYDWVKT